MIFRNRIKSTFLQHYRTQYSFFQFLSLWGNFAIHHGTHVYRCLSSFAVFIQAGQIHFFNQFFGLVNGVLHFSAGNFSMLPNCYLRDRGSEYMG